MEQNQKNFQGWTQQFPCKIRLVNP